MSQAERAVVLPEELATKVSQYIGAHHEGEKTLRDNGQIDVFESLQLHLEAGNRTGYITTPTQSGKGVLITEFVELTGLRTLVATYSQELVRRTEQKFRQFAPDVETGKVYNYEHVFDKPVTITTYNSFIKHVESGQIKPEDYDLLICDEGDLALTEKRKQAVSKFPHAIVLGLTASDTYSLDKNMEQVYGECVHRITISEAARMGMISGFSANLAIVSADVSGVTFANEEYNDKALDDALTASTASEASVQVYKALLSGKPTIAHWPGVRMAERAAEKFREAGISSAAISSYNSRKEQREIMRAYKEGTILVLHDAQWLGRGIDEPQTIGVIDGTLSLSPVRITQNARNLGLDPNNPDKHAIHVTLLYKKGKRLADALTFAEVAQAAEIYGPSRPTSGGYERRHEEPEQLLDLKFEGLEVITDIREVLKVTAQLKEQREKFFGDTPEGWYRTDVVKSVTGRTAPWIRNRIKELTVEHPEWILEREARSRKPTYLISTEAIEWMKRKNQEEYSDPPSGWMSTNDVAKAIGRSYTWLSGRIAQLKDENPDLFGIYRGPNNLSIDYMDPKVIEALKIEALKTVASPRVARQKGWETTHEYAQENWLTVHGIAGIIGRGDKWCFVQLRKLKAIDTSISEIRYDSRNHLHEYYNPSVLETLGAEVAKYVKPSEGTWYTAKEARELVSVSYPTMMNWMDSQRELHPEWFATFFNVGGTLSPGLSQDALDAYKAELDKAPSPPEGWYTRTNVANALGKSVNWVIRQIEIIEDTNPSWFATYRDANSRPNIHIAQEAFNELKRMSQEYSKPPKGWININRLAKESGRAVGTLRRILEPIMEPHPEWLNTYYDTQNKLVEFYSPQAVKELKKKAGVIKKPPVGWMKITDALRVIGRSYPWLTPRIKALSETARESRIGSFHGFNNRLYTFISPEFLEELRREVS